VIAGQFLDLKAAADDDITEERARLIATMKSGAYSVEKPLVLGATLARAPRGTMERLGAFGRPLGEAFQLRDDLLGVFGDPIDVGKPVGADIREGKRNLIFVKTAASLPPDARRSFISKWGSASLTKEDVSALRDMVESSGAKASIESLIGALRTEAEDALESSPIEEPAREALRALAAAAIDRRD
jgi:geranylgeranyl diphosphate synthase type I